MGLAVTWQGIMLAFAAALVSILCCRHVSCKLLHGVAQRLHVHVYPGCVPCHAICVCGIRVAAESMIAFQSMLQFIYGWRPIQRWKYRHIPGDAVLERFSARPLHARPGC